MTLNQDSQWHLKPKVIMSQQRKKEKGPVCEIQPDFYFLCELKINIVPVKKHELNCILAVQ